MTRPFWLDVTEFPFRSRFMQTAHGRLHYVDEGAGEPVVFVHGNPTWSFMYRKLIAGLRGQFRCVALDHIGFGLSDKPPDAPYVPQFHAENLQALIESLGLRQINLVIHDWGGSIGMAYALEHPQNIRSVVLFNTHCWSLKGVKGAENFSRIVGGPVGQLLCRRLNAFPRFVMPAVYGKTGRMSVGVHRHYTSPFPDVDSRNASWRLARAIIGQSDWLASLWDRRGALADKPFRILWGLEDPVGTESKRRRWEEAFPNHQTTTYGHVGHFVPEQMGDELVAPVSTFLSQ